MRKMRVKCRSGLCGYEFRRNNVREIEDDDSGIIVVDREGNHIHCPLCKGECRDQDKIPENLSIRL